MNNVDYKALVEKRFEELLPKADGDFESGKRPSLLTEAMRYSLLAGGKRLRPCLLLATCVSLGGKLEDALDFACAIEMIHTYSLIHDDLPGMDNDVLRRGKPTNHVVFGEGQAILAGDGLLNYAFEVMLDAAEKAENKAYAVKAMKEIARGAGVSGMIAGQCADLYAEGRDCASRELLTYIQEGKTMAMIRGAVLAGARLAGASEETVNALSEYAYNFGILFQVTDDILDITADAQNFGKSKGKDAEEGKLTAVSLYGLEGAKDLAEKLKDNALSALERVNADTQYLKDTLLAMVKRSF